MKNHDKIIAIFLLLAVFVLGIVYLFFNNTDKTQIDGNSENIISEKAISENIKVYNPEIGQTIFSPLEIRGEARGTWFFENNFSIILTDWDGRIIGEALASSSEDWMTEEFIPFTATLKYRLSDDLVSSRANIIFQKSNPSGLPENASSLEYVVYIGD
ncbi:MAG: Gmad2 immunoglobulin-like domain-containing protein [Candidatus Pacebacteria bacterium]|nr:Gmad2 immunoglobulin-like domain-containing protein [Candidatus Paceibacterota bacterium]